MYAVIGDPDDEDTAITDEERHRREGLVGDVMHAFDVDLMAFNDAARS